MAQSQAKPKEYTRPGAEKPLPLLKKDHRSVASMQVPDRNRERASPPPAVLLHAASDPVVPAVGGRRAAPIPTIAVNSAPSVPSISVNGTAPPIPTFAFNDNPVVPAIAINDAPEAPRISINNAPSISVSGPSISVSPPSISVNAPTAPSVRPLPTPSAANRRPAPHHAATAPASSPMNRPHFTPTNQLHSRNTGALCANCALPISGRTVSAAGARFHPECFRCHHCSEGLECVAFYPEPESFRHERVGRIRACMAGHVVDERVNAYDDGDESLRFYCHLDYHEFFSPRCKSCKTPIEGEVVVACGAE